MTMSTLCQINLLKVKNKPLKFDRIEKKKDGNLVNNLMLYVYITFKCKTAYSIAAPAPAYFVYNMDINGMLF